MTPSPPRTDVVIIGAGPVGLFAIFECGMVGLRVHVIDALNAPGGQCVALYPEKPIYDIPGFPRIDAAALIDRLVEQAQPFRPVYHFGQQVTALSPIERGWRVTTSADVVIDASAVIVAAGVGAFGPNRPPIAGIERFESTGGVQYHVTRREAFRGKRVVIAGGGDSAVDWAVSLAEIAAQIMVVHRRPKFRAAPDSAAKLDALAAAGAVELVVPYQLAGLSGDHGVLQAVTVRDLAGAERRLPADHLLAFFGLSMSLGPILDWGLDLAHSHIAVDPACYATNLVGVFAIGDVASYPGKLKLILTGFSEAASAAHAIRALAYPDQPLHFEYSTTQGAPGGAPGVAATPTTNSSGLRGG